MNKLEALNKYFGYDGFRSGQEEIIDSILKGEHVVAVLPTGAGKSICYQIPSLISDNFSIVISPLIALMKDQVDSLNQRDKIASFINSTMSVSESEEALQDLAFGKTKLLYMAPERLSNVNFAERLKKLNPSFLFVDEAHCISEWGHNFRPSYTRIREFIEYTGIKNISAFTATATPEVIKDIISQLDLKKPKVIVKGFERDNLYLNVIITKKKNEKCYELISNNLLPAIIYTSSRKKAEEVTEYLNMRRIKCAYYHAGLAPVERKKVQEDFLNGVIPVIAATNAFGMGIDKKDIRLIIHYNTPGSVENYYQEIGRAGRDGREAHIYLLHDEQDIKIQNYFISQSHPDKDLIQKIYNAICDYGRIAVGNISGKEIPLNNEFITAYVKRKISKGLIYSSLRFLENAGYLKLLSEYDRKEKIQILWDKERLKDFVMSSADNSVKEIILLLVREFGGDVFTRPVEISVSQFFSILNLDYYDIKDILNMLNNMGILSYEEPLSSDSVRLTEPRVEEKKLKLNYKRILESYISLQNKVDKMVDYVFTDGCRFQFILRYFGENTENYRCNKCDRCLNESRFSENVKEYVSEVILKTLDESKKILSENLLISILRGKSKSDGKPELSSFGVCRNYSREELKIFIRSLIEKGFIEEVKERTRGLKITGRGLFHITGRIDQIPLDNKNDYENDLALFNLLRECRSKAAKKFNQNGLIICPDETLREFARIRPETKTEFMSVKGSNPRMFNKIGEEFLEIIRNYKEEPELNLPAERKRTIPSNIQETYTLLKKGYSLKDISQLRKTPEAIISMQIESIIEYEPDIDINHLFNLNELKKIRAEIRKGYTDLKDLKMRLDNSVTYPMLRIAVAKHKFSLSSPEVSPDAL